MNANTQRALRAINDRFYRVRAGEFSATREAPWPGWERVLAATAREGALSVLDVGCGNGRFARYLAARAGRPLQYVGVDSSVPLLAIARERSADGPFSFEALDCIAEPDALPAGPFDLVAVFGLLHHVPSFARRRALLRALASRVSPRGILALTLWQFAIRERFERRIVSCETLAIDPAELEPGDCLVRWGDAGRPPDALRYCHFADAREVERLLQDLPLRAIDSYDADGREGDLNRYVLMTALRSARPAPT